MPNGSQGCMGRTVPNFEKYGLSLIFDRMVLGFILVGLFLNEVNPKATGVENRYKNFELFSLPAKLW